MMAELLNFLCLGVVIITKKDEKNKAFWMIVKK